MLGTIDGINVLVEDDAEVCVCAAAAPPQATMTSACVEQYFYGDGVSCNPQSSITNVGSCPDAANPSTGDEPDPPPNDCDANQCLSFDGDCCNPSLDTDCCCPGQSQNCEAHDFTTHISDAPVSRMGLLSSLGGSTIELTVNPTQSYKSTATSNATGVAGYSYKTSCGVARCPFVLGEYELDASSSLVVNVKIGSVTKQKTVSNLNVKLAYPAIGNHTTSTKKISFSPGALVYLVEFDLSGAQFGSENGHYIRTTRNAATVYGTTTQSTRTWKFDNLQFDLTDITQVPTRVKLTSSMTLTDTAPASTHTQSLTCVGSQGSLVLQSTATDGDGDLGVELWWIDGVLKKLGRGPFTTLLANGTHRYEHRSFDLRGGYENVGTTVVVSCP